MSAPSQHLRQAEHISYGLLAANSVDALNKLIHEANLTQRDQENLQKAAIFLSDIADGADLITNATYRGHNSLASVKAFDVAIGPLEKLQNLAQDEKVVDILRYLSDLVQNAIQDRELAQRNRDSYKGLTDFFSTLNQSLMREMVRGRQALRRTKLVKRHHPAT